MKVVISGSGVVSPIGIGLSEFMNSLRNGISNFSQLNIDHCAKLYSFPGAFIEDFDYKNRINEVGICDRIKKKAQRLRNLSEGCSHGVYASLEAWSNSSLEASFSDPNRIAIVSSGSNVQQAYLSKIQTKYKEKLKFLNPTYGFSFLDTDIIGVLSELLNIRGEGHSIGAASASGNMAIIQGYRLIKSGAYDAVLVVAPSMELTIYEYQALTSLGAMAEISDLEKIDKLCNPFDVSHCGFVYGQNSGAIILETEEHAKARGANYSSSIISFGTSMDGNRNPNPSAIGEAMSMKRALWMAGLEGNEISYVNTHGTASKIGDNTEVSALVTAGLKGVQANASKSIIGHGISAAGVVEAIVCLNQIKDNFLHPNPHLETPISDDLSWVGDETTFAQLEYVMSNSFGFGGVNTSIIFQNEKNRKNTL